MNAIVFFLETKVNKNQHDINKKKEVSTMAKMLISVELEEEETLGRLAKIENLASQLYSEIHKLQKDIIAKEKADSDEEPAQGN